MGGRFYPGSGYIPDFSGDDEPAIPPMFCKASDLPEPQFWDPPSILPVGALTILQADPGIGKTRVALDFAARISTGRELPDGTVRKMRGVLFLSTEDDRATQLRPRLQAMGADLDVIYFTTSDRFLHSWSPQETTRAFEDLKDCDIGLIVLDPLGSFLSVDNENNERDVRSGLGRWLGPASEFGISILGIKHVTKSQQRSARMAGLGSVAFPALARSQLTIFGKGSGGVMTSSKNNYLKKWAREYKTVELPHPRNAGLTFPGIEWGRNTDASADEHYAAVHRLPNSNRERVDGIDDLLSQILQDGPVPVSEVHRLLEEENFSKDQARRSSERLGILKLRNGSTTTWQMPSR